MQRPISKKYESTIRSGARAVLRDADVMMMVLVDEAAGEEE